MKVEARNIAQRYAIFFVLNSVTLPPQRMENFSRPLYIMQSQGHKPFAGRMLYGGRTLVEDEQRSGRPSAIRAGDKTARVRELVDLLED
jgi:hypothetical protein